MAKDLVGGKDVKLSKAKFEIKYNGQKYYFWAQHCKMQFDKDPLKYIK